MPEGLEVKRTHFLKGLLRRPSFEGDAVSGDEYAAAVTAQPAVHQDSSFRLLANEREKLGDMFVLRRSPAIARYVDEMHAQGFRVLAFLFHRTGPFPSKVDNGVDAELFKLLNSFLVGLRPSVQKTADPPRIGDAWNVDFLCKRGLRGGRSAVMCDAAPGGDCQNGGERNSSWNLPRGIIQLDADGTATCPIRTGGGRQVALRLNLVGGGRRAARGQTVRQRGEYPVPAIFVLKPNLVVGNTRMPEGDLGLVSTCFHRDGHDRLGAFSGLGHPGVRNAMGPIDLEKASVEAPTCSLKPGEPICRLRLLA